jgi:hypothetical protein
MMPQNEPPERPRDQWLEDWQQQDQQRYEQQQKERRSIVYYMIGILLGVPLLAFLFCCGIIKYQGGRKDTNPAPKAPVP